MKSRALKVALVTLLISFLGGEHYQKPREEGKEQVDLSSETVPYPEFSVTDGVLGDSAITSPDPFSDDSLKELYFSGMKSYIDSNLDTILKNVNSKLGIFVPRPTIFFTEFDEDCFMMNTEINNIEICTNATEKFPFRQEDANVYYGERVDLSIEAMLIHEIGHQYFRNVLSDMTDAKLEDKYPGIRPHSQWLQSLPEGRSLNQNLVLEGFAQQVYIKTFDLTYGNEWPEPEGALTWIDETIYKGGAIFLDPILKELGAEKAAVAIISSSFPSDDELLYPGKYQQRIIEAGMKLKE